MSNNAIKTIAKNISLTDRQRQIIVGLMLGDGHLESRNNRTYRLKVEHSIGQKEYTDWLYAELRDLVITEPQVKDQIVNGKKYQKYWFNTLSCGSLRFYGQLFYQDKKKLIPKQISKFVSPLSLAIWFMDDGSLKSSQHRARIINTQCFDLAGLERLQEMFRKLFNVHTTLRKQPEGYQMYIPSTEIEKFVEIVRPYIIPTMDYKIKLT